MHLTPNDQAGLAHAMTTIEHLLRRIATEVDVVPRSELTNLTGLPQASAQTAVRTAHPTGRANAELYAAHSCLTAAGAMLDISQTLLRCNTNALSPNEHRRYLRAMVSRTKTAGRAAYRAALILTDPRSEEAATCPSLHEQGIGSASFRPSIEKLV